MNFGIITTQPCVNTAPVIDPRCSDPEFARLNPDLCPAQPGLVIKPAVAMTCQLGTIQFRAFKVTQGVEQDVTGQATFTSSDVNTAVIGVNSGSASGLAIGTVTIGATYQGMQATAELDVMNCDTGGCQEIHVALMVLVDITKSMGLGFSANYTTRLDYAKAAARQFVTEINAAKDSVGLMTFTDTQQNLLAAPTGDISGVAAMVDGIIQTQDKTSFFQAVTQAVSTLNAVTADRRVIYIISDGEETTATDSPTNDPFTVLSDFKTQGGIVMCLGTRASNTVNGFSNLSLFSTGGFFVNAYPATETAALQYISGLKGYICAGHCTPAGDFITNQGKLNYTAFINWVVSGGNVDLLGNGFIDLVPGNGLYVDLAGSAQPYDGLLTSVSPFNLISSHDYTVTLRLAGNQQNNPNDLLCLLKVISGTQLLLAQSIAVSSSGQDFQDYSFSFTAPGDMQALITIQQSGLESDPRWGLLLDEVKFVDTTDMVTLLDDTFDTENPVYVPPSCGVGTTYVYLSSLGHYGYAVGTDCQGGYGCLDVPPGIQLPDPNPLSEIESGTSPPPQQFTSTKTKCASCPDGSINVAGNLIPVMTGPGLPSGTASASSQLPTALAWQAFGGTGWETDVGTLTGWLSYEFPSAEIVQFYIITALGTASPSFVEEDAPRDWTFEGSNDGSTWTTLDTQTGQAFRSLDRRPFFFDNTTTYLHYRLNISANNGDTNGVGVSRLEMFGSQGQSCATATETGSTQAQADDAANTAALAAAQAAMNCLTLYTRTVSYTATCPPGKCGTSVTKSATASSFISGHAAAEDADEMAKMAALAAIDCNQCNNNYTMVVADAPAPGQIGVANMYPSCACISGLPGVITKVTITLIDLYHTWPSDLHIILRHPDGTAIYLMGNCGSSLSVGTYLGGGQIIGPVVTLDDDAGSPLPTLVGDGPIVTGVFQPTLMGPQVIFPPPAPQGPGLPTTLASLIGKDPNGTWSLWVVDIAQGNTGGIAGGWTVNITSA